MRFRIVLNNGFWEVFLNGEKFCKHSKSNNLANLKKFYGIEKYDNVC